MKTENSVMSFLLKKCHLFGNLMGSSIFFFFPFCCFFLSFLCCFCAFFIFFF